MRFIHEVLAVYWSSVWSKVQIICTQSSGRHCHYIISRSIKILSGSTFLVPAYPGSPVKEAIKRVPVWLSENQQQ